MDNLIPRTVVDTAEHVMRSSDPLIGPSVVLGTKIEGRKSALTP